MKKYIIALILTIALTSGATWIVWEKKKQEAAAKIVQTALSNELIALIDKINENVECAPGTGFTRLPDTPPLEPITPKDIQRFRELISLGADVNIQKPRGLTPLMAAVLLNNLDLVQFLIDRGATIDEKNTWNGTALTCAAAHNHFEIAQFLINQGANLNAQETTPGYTALTYAVAHENIPLVNSLLQKGAHVDIQTAIGTLSDIANRNYNEKIIEFLRLYGANLESKTDYDKRHSGPCAIAY